MTNLETRNACMRELERNKEDDQIENDGTRKKEGVNEENRNKEGVNNGTRNKEGVNEGNREKQRRRSNRE